jgi:DNA (cytosine-5)-methyltransferase 1
VVAVSFPLRPRAVVMENVEGLLSYKKGAVLRDLIETLRELGYSIDAPWILAAEQYGVPQMRRRVFLVASSESPIRQPEPSFARCLGRRETDRSAYVLPYPVTAGEALAGLPPLS